MSYLKLNIYQAELKSWQWPFLRPAENENKQNKRTNSLIGNSRISTRRTVAKKKKSVVEDVRN